MPCPGTDDQIDVVRLVRGLRGDVRMRMELIIRFDYGSIIPWVRRREYGLRAVAGPSAIRFEAPMQLESKDFRTTADFHVVEGQTVPFRFTWFPSHQPGPVARDWSHDLEDCVAWWHDWAARCTYDGRWGDAVKRSLTDLEGAHLSADRRHRRRGHHIPARTAGRSTQLGLSILLDPRRRADPRCPGEFGPARRSARLARLVAARRRR